MNECLPLEICLMDCPSSCSSYVTLCCHRYLFTCDDWLSAAKGQTRQFLTVSDSYAYPDSSILVRRNVSERFFEDHMWLSVGYRAKKSLFTRAQRLGACMATLFLAMITNCMFFRDASEEEPAQKIQIGPIAITGPQLFASIITSLIVIPPILVITILFSKAKPKVRGPMVSVDGYRTATTIGMGKLPHWCTHIGWVLVFLSVSMSAIFTIFYSMQWGRVKSQSWLQAFILSFIESAILIQPLKVGLHLTNQTTFQILCRPFFNCNQTIIKRHF